MPDHLPWFATPFGLAMTVLAVIARSEATRQSRGFDFAPGHAVPPALVRHGPAALAMTVAGALAMTVGGGLVMTVLVVIARSEADAAIQGARARGLRCA
jgi:hypothetical protein